MFRRRIYEFDEDNFICRGDPVVVVETFVETTDEKLAHVLERPQLLDAWFDGERPIRDRKKRLALGYFIAMHTDFVIGDKDLLMPHIRLRIPGEIFGEKRDRSLTITGAECYWTLPSIYQAGIEEVAKQVDLQIPDYMPPTIE